jgi:hypothetical protein
MGTAALIKETSEKSTSVVDGGTSHTSLSTAHRLTYGPQYNSRQNKQRTKETKAVITYILSTHQDFSAYFSWFQPITLDIHNLL